MTRQAVELPRIIAERLQTAVDLYDLAYKLQTQWCVDRGEGTRAYERAADHVQMAANAMMDAVAGLLMLHHFEELDEEAAGNGKPSRKGPKRGRE